jgi:hypothetical protein
MGSVHRGTLIKPTPHEFTIFGVAAEHVPVHVLRIVLGATTVTAQLAANGYPCAPTRMSIMY